MKDPKEEQWYFINITDIGPSSVSYFDVHDFDIYSIFVCVLYDSEINTNKYKQTNRKSCLKEWWNGEMCYGKNTTEHCHTESAVLFMLKATWSQNAYSRFRL